MIDWTKLDPTFATNAQALLLECANKGVKMVPCEGLRTLDEQNRLYRQSRRTEEIRTKMKILTAKGAPYLAQCLTAVGHQKAKPYATNAVGGLSWHNWGLAMDCYWMDGPVVNWDGTGEGYQIYGELAKKIGLKWGATFSSLSDYGHVQGPMHEPADAKSYKEINDHFQLQAAK